MARVTHVTHDSETCGELLLTDRSIHFVPEDSGSDDDSWEPWAPGRAQCWALGSVTAVGTRRWCLQERAVELFLSSGHAQLLAFDSEAERANFLKALKNCHLPNKQEEDTLAEAMNQWRNGSITNWEYLMRLNGLAGRSYNDLMQYPVLPFVLADYTSRVLDLTAPETFRDLTKPMAVQRKSREQHYINTYNDLKAARREGCSPVVARQPHHYASLYSNSGGVLHYLVRLPPFTELFLNYQDNNFDMPDRTFHSLATTWRLITNDSPTDVKELIPELFYLPELFHNNEDATTTMPVDETVKEDKSTKLFPIFSNPNPGTSTPTSKGSDKNGKKRLPKTTSDQYVIDAGQKKFGATQCKECVTQEADEETKLSCPTDGSGNLLLDCPHATLYLRFPHERELKGWRYMIRLAAFNNGAQIHHQQLTKEDVPTIVDKCISFIYAHGSLSEGIYRRAGSSTVLSELLARFRRDAWSVQLSPSQHSEHDVAGVLKRFFRDLPEALVPQEKHLALTTALEIKEDAARHAEYRNVMTSLPLVARNTARKLFAHLHFLTTMAHANKMSAENLASVWAPTIMPAAVTSDKLQTAWSTREVFVVRDLIANFEAVWEPTDAEKRREAAVRRVLMTVLGAAAPAPKKAAGDLRAWIYVKNRSTCHQVTLTPNKTCADVCIELCEKANMESHQLMIEEVICNESMRRIVHIDEVVLDVVLRWGYWDEEDRKANYLLVKDNKILNEIEALRHSNSLVCGELKLATESMRSFKLHMFEVQNSKLCYFKDKQGSHKIEEWNVKDILWYTGHEPKRNPQSRWAITFIPRNNKQKRGKDRPWFGCTIAGAVTEDQLKWMAALMFGEHTEILPTPRLVIT
ncbi:arf-GAP with Rho-GAP domain, ANK repeat and PH domain-containing protein 1-like [Ostrinia furnacalis]|uniref:arf-GAP with Rho-GAP domain, ANK repeat and PH domain-containing protein 1-like n=1 Tax=Ostrinia furnacalis TaxID=93504 RepID=UPI001040C2AB|nr:arf-GAP with Rho-GAP domain, ANK repeat and PH domain-containing protein 1-like [Ostrinia furnacalis]